VTTEHYLPTYLSRYQMDGQIGFGQNLERYGRSTKLFASLGGRCGAQMFFAGRLRSKFLTSSILSL